MANLTPVQLLREAKKRLESGWCKGSNARDKDGNSVHVLDKDATCFCANGALLRANHSEQTLALEPAFGLLGRASKNPQCFNLPGFNDSQRTRRPVIALFNRAIKIGEADAKECRAAARASLKAAKVAGQ